MSEAKTTIDHEEIRRWAEERGGVPATVKDTGKRGQAGILRLDFEPRDEALEEISWEEFFEKFDKEKLAFLHQDETGGGSTSRFHKFVERQADAKSSGGKGGARSSGAKASSAAKAGSGTKTGSVAKASSGAKPGSAKSAGSATSSSRSQAASGAKSSPGSKSSAGAKSATGKPPTGKSATGGAKTGGGSKAAERKKTGTSKS